MNIVSVVILIAIIAGVVLSIRYTIKNPDPCDTCSGNSLTCTKKECSRSTERDKDFYRDIKLQQLWEEESRDQQ